MYTRLACVSCGLHAFQLTIESCRCAYPWQPNIGPNESFQILILLLQLVPKSATRGCLLAAVQHTVAIHSPSNHTILAFQHRTPLPHRLATSCVAASPHPISLQQNDPLCHYRNSKPAPPTSTAGHGARKPWPKTTSLPHPIAFRYCKAKPCPSTATQLLPYHSTAQLGTVPHKSPAPKTTL